MFKVILQKVLRVRMLVFVDYVNNVTAKIESIHVVSRGIIV